MSPWQFACDARPEEQTLRAEVSAAPDLDTPERAITVRNRWPFPSQLLDETPHSLADLQLGYISSRMQ